MVGHSNQTLFKPRPRHSKVTLTRLTITPLPSRILVRYALRISSRDGANWSEYFHFSTASDEPSRFSFIYLGDAQNQVRMHWSRVFREAFRERLRRPRITYRRSGGFNDSDVQWGDWHQDQTGLSEQFPLLRRRNHECRRIGEGPGGNVSGLQRR